MRRLLLISTLLLAGCQNPPRSFMDAVTPETVTFGVTDQNLFNGPIYGTPQRGQRRPDDNHFGAIGGMLTFTYRLKPIRIERGEVQPVRVVKQPPATPFPRGEGEAP